MGDLIWIFFFIIILLRVNFGIVWKGFLGCWEMGNGYKGLFDIMERKISNLGRNMALFRLSHTGL